MPQQGAGRPHHQRTVVGEGEVEALLLRTSRWRRIERARIAAELGYRYLQVDATDQSRPILQRLGFAALSTTTPYLKAAPAA